VTTTPPDLPPQSPAPSAQELRDSSLRGGVIALSAEVFRGIIAVAHVAVLARLLSPEDFGLVAIPTAIYFIVAALAPFGLGSAILYLFDLTEETLNSIFWTTVVFSTGVGLLLIAAAPLVGKIYGRSELVPLMMTFSVIAMLGGLAAVPSHLTVRKRRFGAQALIELAAIVVSAVGAVGAAFLGFGHWALVWSHLLLQATSLILFFMACGWRPGRPHISRSVLPALRYGAHLTAFHSVSALRARMDYLLIGRFLGTTPLGTYSASSDLLTRIAERLTAPVRGIAVGTLSRLQQNPHEYRQLFRTTILWSTSIALPVVCLAALEPRLMVQALLGSQWDAAVPIFRILTITVAANLIRPATSWVFQSLGQTDRQLRWGIAEAILFLIAFVIGIRWGIIGVAMARGVISVVLVLPRALYCYRLAPLGTRDLLAGIWRPWAAAGIAALLWSLMGPLPSFFAHTAVQLAASLVVFGLTYATIWVLIPGGWALALEAGRAATGSSPS
jgi:O-antigen/teichoic acid export membrane protein